MDDTRCCGTGTCLINAEGRCWCGQQWDGDKMCFPTPSQPPSEQPVDPGGNAGSDLGAGTGDAD